MDVIIKTGFQAISHQIKFQPETGMKGKKLADAEHVRNVEEHRRNNQSYLIKCRVIRQTSVHKTPYNTSLKINASRCVTDTYCDCVYNQSSICKHIAALIFFINNEESASKTSTEQQWGKPSPRQFAKKKYSKGAYFEAMVPQKYTQLDQPQEVQISELLSDSPLKKILIAQSTKTNIHTVKNVIDSLLTQVEMNIEKETCAECVNNFLIFAKEHNIYTNGFQLELNIEKFFIENLRLSEKEIIGLCCDTLKQSSSREWYKARRLRISASTNVHSIKTLSRKPVEKLVGEMLHPDKVDCASTRYGLREEPKARKQYEEVTHCIVKSVGVIVSLFQPWLCASLDGVVIEDGCISKIVEFKCPSSCENKPVVNFAENLCNVKYLQCNGDDLLLKKSDSYFTQIQVQMYVSGMTVCDLFVYSPVENGSCLIEVHRDEDFLKTVILKSENFYFQHYLPALYSQWIAENEEADEDNIENQCDDADINSEDDSDINLPKRCFTGKNINNIA